jgi:hypothetical protein
LGAALKALQVSKSREQSILQGIFCVVGVAHDAESRTKQRPLMAVKERVECLSIALLTRLYQAFFIYLRAKRNLGAISTRKTVNVGNVRPIHGI